MIEEYLAKFEAVEGASYSKRGVTYPIDCTMTDEKVAELKKDGYIVITDEEFQYYIGNKGQGDNNTGYVRDNTTGKPVSAPAYVATQTEKADSLAAAYKATVNEINDNIVLAMAEGDTATVTELKAEKEAALTEYKTKLEAVNNG